MESSQLPANPQVDTFFNLIKQIYQDFDKGTFDEVALDLMIKFHELPDWVKVTHSEEIRMLVAVTKKKDFFSLKGAVGLVLGERTNEIKENTTALAVGLLENLIASLGEAKPTDAAQPVSEYLQITRDLIAENLSLFHKIDSVNTVLESHGWKNGTFLYPPKLDLLIVDLQTVLVTGRPPLKRSTSMTDSQKIRILRSDPVITSVVRTLIQDVLSLDRDLNKSVIDYFETIDTIAVARSEAKTEFAPVTKVLIDYGWTPKGFGQPIDREILAKNLKIVAGEIKA